MATIDETPPGGNNVPFDHGPFAVHENTLTLDENLRRLDLSKLAAVRAQDKLQQAEEERDAAKMDFAALDYWSGEVCKALGVEKIEQVIRAINELKTDRDRLQLIASDQQGDIGKLAAERDQAKVVARSVCAAKDQQRRDYNERIEALELRVGRHDELVRAISDRLTRIEGARS